ncbi:MAG TPA: response regulator, partial [Candidatus Dormibacteraeota bacterium]|nr:response regulator [Candidatus Dormibacteraeota bacterium]
MKATKQSSAKSPQAVGSSVTSIDASVLVVEDEPMMGKVVVRELRAAGCDVTYAANGEEALIRLREALPDLVISDVNMPGMDGFELLKRIRSQAATRALPVILMTARGDTEDVVAGLGLGADDYLVKPFAMRELLARARAKVQRPPVPVASLTRDRPTGVLSEGRFNEELDREVARAHKTKRDGAVAYIVLHELARLRTRFSARVQDQIELQVVDLVRIGAGALDLVAHDERDRFLLLLPETSEADARRRLMGIIQRIADHEFNAGSEVFKITPVVGFAEFGAGSDAKKLAQNCSIATQHAEAQLDLVPVAYRPAMLPLHRPSVSMGSRAMQVLAWIPLQIVITQALALGLPLALYLVLDSARIEIVPIVYIVVVIALLVTAALIWVEGFLALGRKHPPHLPEDGYVPATAIIAAYLPNEAATIVDTIRSFQRIDYPAGLQIVLAYNTPRQLPIENTLREISSSDPRFRAIKVEGSESKAQNINA